MTVSAPPSVRTFDGLDAVEVHRDRGDVAGQPHARAVGRQLDLLADVGAVEVQRVGAALALDDVAAVARDPTGSGRRRRPAARCRRRCCRRRGRCRAPPSSRSAPSPPRSVVVAGAAVERERRQRADAVAGRRSCRRRRGPDTTRLSTAVMSSRDAAGANAATSVPLRAIDDLVVAGGAVVAGGVVAGAAVEVDAAGPMTSDGRRSTVSSPPSVSTLDVVERGLAARRPAPGLPRPETVATPPGEASVDAVGARPCRVRSTLSAAPSPPPPPPR